MIQSIRFALFCFFALTLLVNGSELRGGHDSTFSSGLSDTVPNITGFDGANMTNANDEFLEDFDTIVLDEFLFEGGDEAPSIVPIDINDEDTSLEWESKDLNARSAPNTCLIWADGNAAKLVGGRCYNVGGSAWNDRVTHVQASSNTCVTVYEHHEGGRSQKYCGSDWGMLDALYMEGSRFCCSSSTSASSVTSPVSSCSGNGGGCTCGKDGNGKTISMNRFWGDNNDEKVEGCGGAFQLSGADWSAQWSGGLSAGFSFSQSESFYGWEACCAICGYNLQMAGKISDGWYCEKDFFATGIWLKGVNQQ